MASNPGILTDWPWTKLGSFKYLLLSPLVANAIHGQLLAVGHEADTFILAMVILVALRYLMGQLWITLSRFQNVGSKHQIQSKGIQFEQVDREATWDDNIIVHALLLVALHLIIPAFSNLPLWNTKGVILMFLIHAGPSEFLYYWLHRALHHHFLYARLFMPIYDYIYGTVDKSTDSLYEDKRRGNNEKVHFVYLTHATSLLSIFHLRLGFRSFAAMPYSSKWYMLILWPISNAIMLFLWIFGRTFNAEKIRLNQLNMQTWVIPRYTFQYFLTSEKSRINQLIEKSILAAELKGIKVISLGLLNKSEDLNGNGELFLKRHEDLKIRVVDGSTLAAAVVLNTLPEGEKEVLLSGGESKVG